MIIPVAGRTQEGVQALLEAIKCRAFQAETIAVPLKRCASYSQSSNLPSKHALCYHNL